MLGNDGIETASTEVTLIWRWNDIEKSTWKTHRYFVNFESRIHIKISSSNRCHNFHMDSPFKIDVISMNFPRGISTSNRCRIDEDVSIGNFVHHFRLLIFLLRHFRTWCYEIDKNRNYSTNLTTIKCGFNQKQPTKVFYKKRHY